MNAAQARAIIAQARKDETYEGPMPEDDAKAISEAEGLVEMAQSAWDQYVRGPEVEALLRLAAEDFDGSDPEPEAQVETPPEPETETDGGGGNDDPPKAPPAADEPDLSQIEPWEGYETDKASDIIDGINAAEADDNYSAEDLAELMSNVWAYEEAHKNRSTILSHLEGVAARLSSDDEPEPEQEPEPQPEPEPEPEQPEEDPEPESDPESDPEPEPEPEPEPKVEEKPKAKPRKKKAEEPGDETDAEDYANLKEQVEAELRRERVHIPEPPTEDAPELPFDWTRMSDKELHAAYGAYSNLAYFKGYQLAYDERMANHSRQAADELHRELLVKVEKYDEKGKQKTMTVLEAEIEDMDAVKVWRRRQRKHEMFATAHRQERDSLGKLVEALSRMETMRYQEWERSGGKTGRSK